ncbi:hypothetical protein J7J00_25355 [Bacillus sp. ISL-4]|uniref:hypothetical protein n=1 Tax=Bacillus sp. ISL-4 TaxID=2819125 RepID=UPI001BE8D908|nr:hypothetical protein [Bacillus sp. ISL-4]MBT2668761.1 hypothetical protein [Bacillus sp. ISL-4]
MSKYRLIHTLIVIAFMACFIYSLIVRTPQGFIITFFAGLIGIGLMLLNFALHKYPMKK